MVKILQPVELDFLETAPWRFDCRGHLDGSTVEVWKVFIDNEGWADWFQNCKECRSTSSPTGGVGSTRSIRVNGLRVDERFIGWEPERLWAFTVVGMSVPFATRMAERATFTEIAADRTQVDYRIALEPVWWAKPVKPFLGVGMRRTFAASFAAMNRRLADGSTR